MLTDLAPLPAPWLPIDQAPRDGTPLILAVIQDDDANGIEDTQDYTRTVGFNEFDDNGDDTWQFVGWCWSHDHYIDGSGTPVYFQHLPALRPDPA